MRIHLEVRNESGIRGVYRRDTLTSLAQRVCGGEWSRLTRKMRFHARGIGRARRKTDGRSDRGQQPFVPDVAIEISLLLCDDAFIGRLNKSYRGVARPTDVLAFAQAPHLLHAWATQSVRQGAIQSVRQEVRHEARQGIRQGIAAPCPFPLGDIVISLETVARNCRNCRQVMRDEVKMLFCHGLLHLLGYDHDTALHRHQMAAKQARYLAVPIEAAWPDAALFRRAFAGRPCPKRRRLH